MTTVRMCDECKTIEPQFANWFHVDQDEHIISFDSQIESTKDYHFCTWECISAFASRKTGKPTTV